MTPKGLHFYLLSLFMRGLGAWILYESLPSFYSLWNDIYLLCFPTLSLGNPPQLLVPDWSDISQVFMHLAAAIYFLLGMPPFLQLAAGAEPKVRGRRVQDSD